MQPSRSGWWWGRRLLQQRRALRHHGARELAVGVDSAGQRLL